MAVSEEKLIRSQVELGVEAVARDARQRRKCTHEATHDDQQQRRAVVIIYELIMPQSVCVAFFASFATTSIEALRGGFLQGLRLPSAFMKVHL